MKWYRLLLHAYPRAFRMRFGQDLEELFADVYRTRTAGLDPRGRFVFWFRLSVDTVRHGLSERLPRRRRLPLGAHHSKGSVMAYLLEDLRHASRALHHQRGLSGVVLLTLALAIGANSAIFTIVNAVLLRPLPYADPDRLVMIYMVTPNGRDTFLSIPDFEDFRHNLTTVRGLSLMGTQTANLTGVAEPDRLRAGFVTADFFDTFGVQPIIGRAFRQGEDARGAAKTAVLEYDTWQARFGGDPAILGRSLILNNEPHEVIGILPPQFEFPIAENDVWLPYSSLPIQDPQRASRNWFAFGRLATGVTMNEAQAELRQFTASLAQAYPDSTANWTARFEGVYELSVMLVSRNLRVLWAAIGFVLLIACANIANLLLARASARQREIAVRAALGASRARIVRQLLLESILIALGGGALGLLLSALFTDGMLTLLPNLPRSAFVRPDATVVVFTAAVSITTGLLFGLVPALRLSRTDLRSTLSEGGRGGEGRGAARVRGALVIAELALAVVLLTGAGLFIQSLTRLVTVDMGYDPANVLTLEYRLPRNKYSDPPQQAEFHQRVIDRVRAVPGVQNAAFARAIPQSGNGGFVGYWRAGDAEPSRETMPRAQYNVVSSDYFAVMGIPLQQGRVCDDTDAPEAPLSIVVNEMLAQRLWPDTSAVGRALRAPDIPGEAQIIGVVGNTRHMRLSDPLVPQIYGCLTQQPGIFATLTIKTAGDPLAVTRSVQQAIWSIDADQPMWKIRTAESMIAASVQRERFVMVLMSLAAGLALLLAGLGTYSVLAYTVERRAREVGVRMALGATRANIIRLVLGQTAWLTVAGIGIGLVGAMALGGFVASQLYEVSPRDPVTLAVTALTLAGVAIVAAYVPTRRASGVQPVDALRGE